MSEIDRKLCCLISVLPVDVAIVMVGTAGGTTCLNEILWPPGQLDYFIRNVETL